MFDSKIRMQDLRLRATRIFHGDPVLRQENFAKHMGNPPRKMFFQLAIHTASPTKVPRPDTEAIRRTNKKQLIINVYASCLRIELREIKLADLSQAGVLSGHFQSKEAVNGALLFHALPKSYLTTNFRQDSHMAKVHDYIVIGAGVSGLRTAQLLELQGKDVLGAFSG